MRIVTLKNKIQPLAEVGMTSTDQDLKRLFQAKLVDKDTAASNMLDPRSLAA